MKLTINELRLRVSKKDRGQGRRLGESVAKQLSELPIATGRSRRISKLSVRVCARNSKSVESLAANIANRIRSRIE